MRADAMSSLKLCSVIRSGARLVPQHRMVEADRVADLEVIRRVDGDVLVAAGHGDRAQHLQVAARPRTALEAGFLDEEQERRGAAVHDRHFALAQLDDDVVDAGADQGRQQVLDGLDGGAVVAQHRGVVDAGHVLDAGRDVDAQVGPAEHDAGAGGGGLQGEADAASPNAGRFPRTRPAASSVCWKAMFTKTTASLCSKPDARPFTFGDRWINPFGISDLAKLSDPVARAGVARGPHPKCPGVVELTHWPSGT